MKRIGETTLDPNIVEVGQRFRKPSEQSVAELAARIAEDGAMLSPITVRMIDGLAHLICGATRLAAMKLNGATEIQAEIFEATDLEVRIAEISENLNRHSLRALDRNLCLHEYRKLIAERDGDPKRREEVSRENSAKPQGGRPRGGGRQAARDLKIDEKQLRDAVKIAALAPKIQDAFRANGLDDKQSLLLTVSKAPQSEQMAMVRRAANKQATKPAKKSKERPRPTVTNAQRRDVEHVGEFDRITIQWKSFWEAFDPAAALVRIRFLKDHAANIEALFEALKDARTKGAPSNATVNSSTCAERTS
ncbi:MAG TPA: ParB N-terminal domain-containing protein [Stellaceae bacterium]|nr:ParB N-terminal domain-containing protein [Stellaceae bacterium]